MEGLVSVEKGEGRGRGRGRGSQARGEGVGKGRRGRTMRILLKIWNTLASTIDDIFAQNATCRSYKLCTRICASAKLMVGTRTARTAASQMGMMLA